MEIEELFFKKKTKSQTINLGVQKIPLMSKKNLSLQELLEEKEEDHQEEDIQNISFSLSNCDDMKDFLDNFSNKSDEKVELQYENTTNEEGLAIIEDYLKESTKQILKSRKGVDDDIKKTTSDFYADLTKNIKVPKTKKIFYLDKTKNTNYITKSESITSDEPTKFKNDLIGQADTGQSLRFNKKNSLNSKNKSSSIDKISSQFMGEEEEEEKIIEIKRKKKVKNNKEDKK